MAEGLLVQSKNIFEIDINPEGPDPQWERLAKGISNFEYSTNDEIDQTHYLDGDGYATTTVMGGQITLTITGHRYYGDPAQDWIFSKSLEIGTGRETQFRWTMPDGGQYEGPCTIANITGPSGDANAKGEISFEIHFNGKPEYIPANGGGGVEG